MGLTIIFWKMNDQAGESHATAESLPIVIFRSSHATRLAQLEATKKDLEFSRDCLKAIDDSPEEGVQLRALWSSALVSYVRGLHDKRRKWVRKHLESLIEELPGEPLELHRWLKDMRDKNIAHDINPYDDVTVTLVLPPEGRDDIEPRVGVFFRLFLGSPDNVPSMLRLINTMLSELPRMIKAEGIEVLKEANSKSMAELRTLPPHLSTAPGPSQAKKTR